MAYENRILLIRRIFLAEDRVVEYKPLETLCPVCQFLGLPPGKVVVDRTAGTIRYCTCEQCSATFRAEGPSVAEIKQEKQVVAEIELNIKTKKSIKKASGKGRKR